MLKHATKGKSRKGQGGPKANGQEKTTSKSKKPSPDGQSKTSQQEDDYGFLIPKGRRTAIITLSAQSPRSEVDYFDECMLDTAFVSTPRGIDHIPVTLGAVKSTTERQSVTPAPESATVWKTTPTSEEISLNIPPSPIPSDDESLYINIDSLDSPKIENTDYYSEKMEGHYARLSEVQRPVDSRMDGRRTNALNFYEHQLDDVRARSRSRNRCRSQSRGRDRSSNRSSSRPRSCSKSRDIMAIYTNQTTSGTQALSPPVMRQSKSRQSESRQVDKRASAPASLSSHEGSKVSQVTSLEMDPSKNAEIERLLESSNRINPANVRMMMIAGYSPATTWSSKDEVSARTGEMVWGLYKQNDWLFIMTSMRKCGFVPFSFTKAVKVVESEKPRRSKRPTSHHVDIVVNNSKPITGILKNSQSRTRVRKPNLPKYSVKVRTSTQDNDSISSENSSIFTEDFVFTRTKNCRASSHADCIVVDVDDTKSSVTSPLGAHPEESGTYCSDSGISDPSSIHSEDLELLNSPTGCYQNMHVEKRLAVMAASTQMRDLKHVGVPRSANNTPDSQCKYYESLTQMPLGPLGQRLARMSLTEKTTRTRTLNEETKERAQSSSTTPSHLRPEIPKDYTGPRVTVVFDYNADNEDDLAVHASDVVTVLNSEDVEWIWVQRRDGKEGFIPREYVIPLEISLQNRRKSTLVSAL